MQVTNLAGTPVLSVTQGTSYLVPCVFGIPVICPSHVDEGTDGPTSKHWHVDDRFGPTLRGRSFWAYQTLAKFPNFEPDDEIRSDILRDEGQPVKMEQMVATKNVIRPSGGVWSTIVWLYYMLGCESAKEGCCVHHKTPLVAQKGYLVCPAHGLRYNLDGSPRYKAPFFLGTRFVDWKSRGKHARVPVCIGKDAVKFDVSGNFDLYPTITLVDANGCVIMNMKSDIPVQQVEKGGRSTLTISIGVWPSTGMCPRLVSTDPRGDF